MARVSVEDLEDLIISNCAKSSIVLNTSILVSKFTWLKIRASLTDGTFIDVSYNQVTEKTAYAQIRDEQRIFGADNKNGWHWHPYEDPQRHDFVDKEITFAEFLKQVEAYMAK
jgi:hypothetical protein